MNYILQTGEKKLPRNSEWWEVLAHTSWWNLANPIHTFSVLRSTGDSWCHCIDTP